jgi:PAS domain S-box-containing protein
MPTDVQERYRRLVELSPEGMCVSVDGRIVFANAAMVQMLGARDVSEVLGRSYREAIHPDSLPLVEGRIVEVWAGNPVPWVEETWLRLDGSAVHVEAAAVPITRHGEVLVQVFVRDLTARKQAEEALQEQRQRLQALFDNSIDAIILIDDAGNYIDVNPAVTKLLGYSREELLRMKIGDITPAGGKDAVREIWRHLVAGEPTHGVYPVEAKNGTRRVVELQTLGHVRPGLHYSILHDITQQKSAEESLRNLSVGLLRSQDEERRRISRQLHETTGQSLAALRMNLMRMKESATPELIDDSLALVEQSIKEIRTLSYLLHPPLMDELGLVSALEWYTAGFEQRSGIAVHFEAEDVGRLPPDVETAVFRIVQEALTNIHRHAESAVATIRLQRVDGNLLVEVADRGRGFADDVAPGVGLAGLNERIRDLQGDLDIRSGEQGTTLTVRLPLSR